MAKQDESFPTQAQLEKIVDEHFKEFELENNSQGALPSGILNKIRGLVYSIVNRYYQDQETIQQNRGYLEELEQNKEQKRNEQYSTTNLKL